MSSDEPQSQDQTKVPPTCEIVDVTLRDGLQNEASAMETLSRVELAHRLVQAGVRRAEVTSFVSPRAVPQMADAEELCGYLRSEVPELTLIGLVVNSRGVERAARAGIDTVNFVVVATDTFSQRNQGEPTADTLRRLPEMVAAARDHGMTTSVTIGAAFGCPFEGEVSESRLTDVVARAADSGPHEIALADTIGVAVPADIRARFEMCRQVVAPDVRWRGHFHNTRNTGIANAIAAEASGVNVLDASLGGIGGCPFAPAATGNIAMEDLVYALERSGIETGISLDDLMGSAWWLADRLGHDISGLLAKAGPFPRAPSVISRQNIHEREKSEQRKEKSHVQ